MKWTLELATGEKMKQQDFDRHCAGFAVLAGCTFAPANNVVKVQGKAEVHEKQTTVTEDDIRTAMRAILRYARTTGGSFTLAQAYDGGNGPFKWGNLLPNARLLICRRLRSFCGEQGVKLLSEGRKIKKLTVYYIIDEVIKAEAASVQQVEPVEQVEQVEQEQKEISQGMPGVLSRQLV